MSNEDLDFVKAKTKEAALSSYRSRENTAKPETIRLRNLQSFLKDNCNESFQMKNVFQMIMTYFCKYVSLIKVAFLY